MPPPWGRYDFPPMALIKCPQCTQTVLSIASRCPRCFSDLKNPSEFGINNEMTECRKCGRGMLARMSACPHCGARRTSASTVGFAVMAVAALGLIGFAVWSVIRQPPATAVALTTVAPAAAVDSIATKTAPAVELRTIAPPLRVRPITGGGSRSDSASPDSSAERALAIARAREALAQATQPADDSAGSGPSVGIKVRWAAQWANVRGAPSADSEVVEVLKPGQQIAIGARRGGWLLVVENGREVGYVAGDLVVDRPESQ